MLQELVASFTRMLIAYTVSLFVAYSLGYIAARDRRMESIIMPVVDVLQSVPILTFFPIALVFLINTLPAPFGAEIAVIFLIVTSMVWNLIFAVYESFISTPKNLVAIASMFRMGKLTKLITLYLPNSLKNVVSNSMVSWANGWYFLIATEIITLGSKSYKLFGIGSLMMENALKGNYIVVFMGVFAVTFVVFLMNILVWKPLLSLISLFFGSKKEKTIYNYILSRLPLIGNPVPYFRKLVKLFYTNIAAFDYFLTRHHIIDISVKLFKLTTLFVVFAIVIGSIYASIWAFSHLSSQASLIPLAFIKSALRILIAFSISLLWTVPAAYFIAKTKVLDAIIAPLFEVFAAIPVTALFPVVALLVLEMSGNLELGTLIFLMTGMQWYIFFNAYGSLKSISAYAEELKRLYSLKEHDYVYRVVFPAMMPAIIIGSISAIGGGWNAIIVSEYLNTGQGVLSVEGLGSLMSSALYQTGDISLLILTSLAVAITIPLINITLWRPLMKRFASERWKM
ncbi:MAG: ABC transporter permease subunit [Methanobacteriota archaeon]|nr:MAG: ABC transporter permease subunit [Euryarchaeota archaeon]